MNHDFKRRACPNGGAPFVRQAGLCIADARGESFANPVTLGRLVERSLRDLADTRRRIEDADFGTAAAVVPDIQQQRILTGHTDTQGAANPD